MKYKILIAEDDKEINALLRSYLSDEGYECLSVTTGLDALRVIKDESPDLVLLDLMLPLKSGDAVLEEVRKFSDIPVIIVSAKDMTRTKIDLMRSGADDYVTKPFDLDELLVRIEAVLRRSRAQDKGKKEPLCFKNLKIDTELKKVFVSGNEITLAAKEYSILELLVENPHKLFSKANLFESIWRENYMDDDNIIKVHMSNIRSKIKEYDPEEYIETVWGMGYRLKN
ncbi:MAG: response regulator transcription factor [Saccharofermentans sp.]|nr:response regulator transcription factor [Saccharofermentans sp.]